MHDTEAPVLTRNAPDTAVPPFQRSADPAVPPVAHQPQTAPTIETRAAVNGEIRALATTFDLGSDWANGLIDRNATEGEARAAALETLRTRAPRAPIITASVGATGLHDDPMQFRSLAGEAVYAVRANSRHPLSEPARAFASMTTLDLARECCRRAGISTAGMVPAETITRALSTSDFPAIFADTANRTLRASYEAAPAVLKRLARQSTAKDFRAKTALQAADMAKLEKVSERGEYKYSAFVEGKESYKIGTYGTIISLSRPMLINDDIGAFTDLSGKLGLASAEFEAQFLVDLLIANNGVGPTMDDGKPVFHAGHRNLAEGDGPLSTNTLSAARLAMRRQTGPQRSPGRGDAEVPSGAAGTGDHWRDRACIRSADQERGRQSLRRQARIAGRAAPHRYRPLVRCRRSRHGRRPRIQLSPGRRRSADPEPRGLRGRWR